MTKGARTVDILGAVCVHLGKACNPDAITEPVVLFSVYICLTYRANTGPTSVYSDKLVPSNVGYRLELASSRYNRSQAKRRGHVLPSS